MKKIIQTLFVPIVAVVLLTGPVFAQEETTSTGEEATTTQETSQDSIIQQLLQQVANLTKQITEMQSQITELIEQKKEVVKTVETKKEELSSKYIPMMFARPMFIGVIGDDVVLLQEFLATDSDLYPEGLITGYYGALTEKAVKRLQEKYGLEMVGVVGPKTREKINKKFHKKDKDKEVPEWITKKKKNKHKKQIVSSVSKITLTANQDTGEVRWESEGVSQRGFKLAWSKNPNPTYPTRKNDKYVYLGDSNSEHYALKGFDGAGEYYVRVCEYLGGKCGVYSNEVTITLNTSKIKSKHKNKYEKKYKKEKKEVKKQDITSMVESIELHTGEEEGEVNWSVNGVSQKGFKLAWSKNPNPTYPTRDGDKYTYLGSSSAESYKISAFDGAGEYYVRVCEYLGGKCGVYSNEIKVILSE